ncbi:ZIP family metal transporter [Candidatus Halobonum tyrrellensis]|uniref:Zinc/iron permease n=1 Tax=Candidatus Halobonum tyrrellensis G22 TaxID=1324957 RepID=V4HL82_9EURY|nr:zinc/iron permease [Candidatus Halobonum tyrrellensis]ESP88684.1 zinc/iron permease [Candidatus Halobonum tyrrellensis G22]
MALPLPVHPVLAQASGAGNQGGLLTNPWFYAVFSGVSLTVGSAIGIWIDPEKRWQAILLAVGGGSLIISLAYELYDPAVQTMGKWAASGVFLGGVATFGGLDILIDRLSDDEQQENGFGLWASITTDGIPENAAMGSLLTGQVHGVLAFLFALAVTNGSQAMLAGTNMSESHGKWKTLGAFVATGIVVGAAVMLGYWYLPSVADFWVAAVRAFAGGAILASLAGEIYPDAYEQAGPYITLATAVGFLGTFLL